MDAFSFLPFGKRLGLPIGGYSGHNRNIICEKALEYRSTHVMLIGPDVLFPPDSIKTLLERDKNIIGANYNERKLPLTSTVKLLNADGHFINAGADAIPKEVFTCGAVGSDFCLLKTAVLETLQPPYFWADYEDGLVTEDVYFCRKARRAGYSIWCDPTVPISHLGDYAY